MTARMRVCLGAVLFEVMLGGIGILLGWLLGVSATETLRPSLVSTCIGVAATLPLLGLFFLLLHIHWAPFQRIRRIVDQFVADFLGPCGPIEFLLIAISAGIGEELLFRGFFQGFVAYWTDSLVGPWFALVVASILFGMAHAITPTYAVLAGVIGLYLGVAWMLTDNLWVPIVAHALYDFVALVYLNPASVRATRQQRHCHELPKEFENQREPIAPTSHLPEHLPEHSQEDSP